MSVALAQTPRPGEVWVFRHLAARGRGHVVIVEVLGLRVDFTYLVSGSTNTSPLGVFLADYVFAAGSLDRLPESEFPQRHAPPRPYGEVRLGTAV